MWGRILALSALLVLPTRIESATDGPKLPVTVTVIDSKTRRPVTEFSYAHWIQVAGDWDPVHEPGDPVYRKVRSPSGTFAIQAPASCRLALHLDSRDAVHGLRSYRSSLYVIRSSDRERKIVATLEIGETVSGTVRDGTTRRPIAGAKVAPFRGMHQVGGPDMARAATTDQDGRFELRGVCREWGLAASHPDYDLKPVFAPDAKKPFGQDLVIELARADMIAVRGIVRDEESRPLAGVSISYDEHVTTSAQDGRFTLSVARPSIESPQVTLRKPGYVEQRVPLNTLIQKEDPVTLVRCFGLEGTVLSSMGRPVETYRIVVGPTLEPVGWECVLQDVLDRAGHFDVSLTEPGSTRVVVRAEGHAIWEGSVKVARKSEPVVIRLRPGIRVSGRVEKPADSRALLHASLVPPPLEAMNVMLDKGLELATFKIDVAPDGSYHFDHVRPHAYEIRIEGADVTPVRRLIQVEDHDLDLGTFKLAGTGRIVGTAHRPDVEGEKEKGGAWAFADGLVSEAYASTVGKSRGFITDEDGHFVIDRVPAGLGGISFFYPGAYEPQDVYFWGTQVFPGKTTEVHAFDPRKDRQLAFSVVVGDGSSYDLDAGAANPEKEQEGLAPDARNRRFKLELAPIPGETGSYSVPADLRGQVDRLRVVIRDVSPGHYHFRLFDAGNGASMAGNLIYQERLIFKPGDPPRRIVLDSSSIRGKVDGGCDGEVIALDVERKQRPRRASCTGDGAFSIPFLRVGTYTLVAYDPRRGWCRGPRFRVGKGFTDADAPKLAPGAEVRGAIVARTPCPIPDAVVAVDPTGIKILCYEFESGRMKYRIPHLWPGDWTIRLQEKGTIITTTRVKISGGESVRADLVVAP